MASFRRHVWVLFLMLFASLSLPAQPWQVKGHGIGLYAGNGADYDQVLRVVQAGNHWTLKQLVEMGAFNGNGPKVFGAWLQGPHTNAFKNQYGTPVYMYKVRVTNPKGESRSYGNYGFYTPGFTTYFLADVQNGLTGTWRVDWFIVHRDTQQETQVASDSFVMGDAPAAEPRIPPAAGQKVCVGLYDGSQPDYDRVLRIVSPGARWSLKQLAEMGAFNGNGPKVFGAWYQGPHTDTFKNQYGTPIYMYKVRVTNPKGEERNYGNYGFYAPGFATYFLADVQNGLTGTWRVDWFTVHRETLQEKQVQSSNFEMVP